MSYKFQHGLFVFRRDLRTVDNIGLHLLSTVCEKIYPIFVFTPEQVGKGNQYKADHAVQFMLESLEDLDADIRQRGGKLLTFYGDNDTVISECIRSLNIEIVVFNMDITPYARKRDTSLAQLCAKKGIEIAYGNDYYLHEPGSVRNGSGDIYVKFTPYYETASKLQVSPPMRDKKLSLALASSPSLRHRLSLDEAKHRFVKKWNPDLAVHGGREKGLVQLRMKHVLKHYATTRDDLTKPTSQLSAFIKFGCLSIREVYQAFQRNKNFVRQLYWREFYANVLFAFPSVLSGHALHAKYDRIRWHRNERWLEAWCKGRTGFPVVDAGMRQLNATGYMHNRARLITMSFLVKIMMIDWREGERYFATHLVDYDPASNNGNTLWVMGGGADSMPWFRYFNPWRQAEEHDPEGSYIRQWIPELNKIPTKAILHWDTEWSQYTSSTSYPKPILNYEEQREKSMRMYKAVV